MNDEELKAIKARDAKADHAVPNPHHQQAIDDRRALLAMVAESSYQLAEEKNANTNDRDPSYHEERLKQENEALARQLIDLRAQLAKADTALNAERNRNTLLTLAAETACERAEAAEAGPRDPPAKAKADPPGGAHARKRKLRS